MKGPQKIGDIKGGDALALAAKELVGTRFRLHGRDPATGLDCAGLVETSLRKIGYNFRAPLNYNLRNHSIAGLLEGLTDCPARRLARPRAPYRSGDIVLCALGAAQNHLLIIDHSPLAPPAFIHAHAGLRRVVSTPGQPPWPALACWRLD